jgi:hypothetical protein
MVEVESGPKADSSRASSMSRGRCTAEDARSPSRHRDGLDLPPKDNRLGHFLSRPDFHQAWRGLANDQTVVGRSRCESRFAAQPPPEGDACDKGRRPPRCANIHDCRPHPKCLSPPRPHGKPKRPDAGSVTRCVPVACFQGEPRAPKAPCFRTRGAGSDERRGGWVTLDPVDA